MPTEAHAAQPNIIKETFQLSALAAANRLADPQALAKFRQHTGLADFYWQVLYDRSKGEHETLSQALNQAEGYVVFLHGWDGSHRIWEDLPLRLLLAQRKIVCLIPDVNGFGNSPFIAETPEDRLCCPTGMMAAIEQWLAIIGLWPAVGRTSRPYYLFVGHSMGGAAIFYKEEAGWRDEIYSMYALSPALLCNDALYQRFYKGLGLGISIPTFSFLKRKLAPRVIEFLGSGASNAVKDEHIRVFESTSFGTLAQTIYAMGALAVKPERTDWPRFQVALGNRDRLVNLNSMLDLLEILDIRAHQIRLALGDHYFFSHDYQSPHSHKHNREAVFQDLLLCCQRLQQEAQAA